MESSKSGDIPLVVSNRGVNLRLLKDCPEWREKYLKA
jgi:hypothetical protein